MCVGLTARGKIGLLSLAAAGYLSYTKSMKTWKMIAAIFCLVGVGQPTLQAQMSYQTPFSVRLAAEMSQRFRLDVSPGTDRLRAMLFYPPDNHMQQMPSFWKRLFGSKEITQQQENAVAFFLFNMYVSTAAYQEDIPDELTLDYLGVLDGFSKCREMFAPSRVDDFYTHHRLAIKERLAEFFKRSHLAEYVVSSPYNDKRERAFLRLLQTAPARLNRPGYTWKGTTRMRASMRREDRERLADLIRQSLAEGENKVVTFKVPRVQLESVDNPLLSSKNGTNRLYRCVNDECAYCSYLLGKKFCQGIDSSYANWGVSRLYKITAYPTAGQFLTPNQGERFKLADGGQASAWYYHTATLVVMNLDGHYTPLVADTFLAGDEPVALETWAQHFASQKTYFQVDVFERNRVVESAIVEPSARRGDKVVVDGHLYSPYDVLP